MGLQNNDKFLVNRSGTDYSETWSNILVEVDADLGISNITDDLSTIRTDSGIGGSALEGTILSPGSGYTDGIVTNIALTTLTGNGSGALVGTAVFSGGVLVSFDFDQSNGGTGYVEGDTVEDQTPGVTGFQLTVTKVGEGGVPLSTVYVPRDLTTLPFLP